MQRWKSIYQEANIFNDFKKILSPVGFRDNDIRDVVSLFQTDFQDLDYKGIMNELVNEWDMDGRIAKNLYNIAKKNWVI